MATVSAETTPVAGPPPTISETSATCTAQSARPASPNSRVGRIAAYRDAVLAGQELEATLAEKEAAPSGSTYLAS